PSRPSFPTRRSSDLVLAHLIGRYYDGDLVAAVRQALALVKGTYGIAVVSRHEPGLIVGARLGSPLVVGVGEDGHYLASDANALRSEEHTSELQSPDH